METRSCLTIVLAAGDSTRMKSSKSKVLHKIAGLPMIAHVTRTLADAGVENAALVLGRDAEAVREAATVSGLSLETFLQSERLGTAHAVLTARAAIERGYDDILVTYGDVPLVTAAPFLAARAMLAEGHDVVVIGFETGNPTGYGRLVEENGRLVAIREERDASEAERRITNCNSGLLAINGGLAMELLEQIGNDNAKGEYYLTDIVEIACKAGKSVVSVQAEESEVIGCNNRAELAEIERIWQQRRRRELMISGVTMLAPETVFLSHDTELAPDVVLEPNVFFGPGVSVEAGAVIHAYCHIEGARIAANSSVGPFARLRPGAHLHDGAKVGNFCEVKNAEIAEGAKVNHLSYIGDASVGAAANIGAGTITCNYDGVNKHRTEIGAGAFIGSNTALVAPVSIGDNSLVAAGSTITRDVPENALAFARARQTVREGRGRRKSS